MKFTSGEEIKSGQAVTGDEHGTVAIDDDDSLPDRYVATVAGFEKGPPTPDGAPGAATGAVHLNIHLWLRADGSVSHCTPGPQILTVPASELRLL